MSPKKRHKRRQLFVDRQVQGALLLRTVLYWLFCLSTVFILLLCWQIVTGPARFFYTHFDEMWAQYGPVLVVSLVLLPVVVIDCIRLSNRFAGPLVRLRRSMRQLAQGEHVRPVHFRKGDFWCDFADDFNTLLARVQSDAESNEDVDNVEDVETPNEAEPDEAELQTTA